MSFFDKGSIILVRDIIFKEGMLDHAYKAGRPCLIIDIDDDYITFLTLSTLHNKKIYDHDYLFNDCDDLNFKNDTYVNLQHIYRKRICFYEEVSHLNQKEYFKILRKFLRVNSKNPSDEFLEIASNIENQLLENKNLIKNYK